jgi:hypothetical protein
MRHCITDSHIVTSWYFESHFKLSVWSEMYFSCVCAAHCCLYYCTCLLISDIEALLQHAVSKFRMKRTAYYMTSCLATR